jgi:hypothetical protein
MEDTSDGDNDYPPCWPGIFSQKPSSDAENSAQISQPIPGPSGICSEMEKRLDKLKGLSHQIRSA